MSAIELPNQRPFTIDPSINEKLILNPPTPRTKPRPISILGNFKLVQWAFRFEPNSWHTITIRNGTMHNVKRLACWTGKGFTSHVTGDFHPDDIISVKSHA